MSTLHRSLFDRAMAFFHPVAGLMPSSRRRVNQRGDFFEPLESRKLLIASIGPLVAGSLPTTFSDSGGDVITIEARGSAGTVTFTDSAGSTLESGEDIGGITITGASPDFVLRLSDNDAGADGDGDIQLGVVTSDKPIRGLLTVGGSANDSVFIMKSFTGPGLTANGLINVTRIIGNTDGDGLVIPAIAPGTTIHVTGDVVSGNIKIAKDLGGTLQVDGNLDAPTIIDGKITPSGALIVGGSILGPRTLRTGDMAGVIRAGGVISAALVIEGNITPSGVIESGNAIINLNISKNLAGQVLARGSFTAIIDGSIVGTGVVDADGSVQLTVGGSTASGSVVASRNSGVNMTVTGGVAGDIYSDEMVTLSAKSMANSSVVARSSVTASLTGPMTGATLYSGVVVTLNAATIAKSRINANSGIAITTTGNISGLVADSSTSQLTLTAGKDVVGSVFNAKTDFIGTVDGKLVNSRIDAGGGVTLTLHNLVTGSAVEGDGSLVMTLDQNVANSRFVSKDAITATLQKNLTGGSFNAANGIVTTINGVVSKSSLTTGGNLTATIAGVQNSSVHSGANLSANFTGVITNSDIKAVSDMSLAVTKLISKSRIAGGAAVSINAEGGLADLELAAGGALSMAVTGDAIRSRIDGTDSVVNMSVTGSMINSQLLSDEAQINLAVTKSLIRSVVANSDAINVSIGGDFSEKTYVNAGDGGQLQINVGGVFAGTASTAGIIANSTFSKGITAKGRVVANNALTATIGGNIAGLVSAGTLDLTISGSVTPTGRIFGNSIADQNGNNNAFSVTGDFLGQLIVSGDANIGSSNSGFITGNVGKNALINIRGNLTGPATAIITGDMLGQLAVGGLGSNLTIGGNASRIVVNGLVAKTILVGKKLDFLASGSLFQFSTSNSGTFLNGDLAGVGSLSTGGIGVVVPLFVPIIV